MTEQEYMDCSDLAMLRIIASITTFCAEGQDIKRLAWEAVRRLETRVEMRVANPPPL